VLDPKIIDPQHLLGMRRFAGMADVDLNDAAKLLATATERSLAAGAQLSALGAPLTTAWFIVEGELRFGDGKREQRAGPYEAVGFLELFGEIADGLEVECVTDAVVLEIERSHLLALLADDFDGLVELLRSFSAAILQVSPFEQSPMRARPPAGPSPLSFVERLVFLHELSAFAEAGVGTVAELALQVSDTDVSGTLLCAGSALDQMFFVVRGALRYGDADVAAGSSFGALHAIGEIPLAHDLVAERGATVIACEVAVVLDMLEDDLPLALTWLRGLAARVVELSAEAIGFQDIATLASDRGRA
jgi:CRP-like cAMP-binding protein